MRVCRRVSVRSEHAPLVTSTEGPGLWLPNQATILIPQRDLPSMTLIPMGTKPGKGEKDTRPSFPVVVHSRLDHPISIVARRAIDSSQTGLPPSSAIRASSSSLTLSSQVNENIQFHGIQPRSTQRISLPRDAIQSRRLDLTLRRAESKEGELRAGVVGGGDQCHRLRVLGALPARKDATQASTTRRWTKARCLSSSSTRAGFRVLQVSIALQ